MIVCLCALAVAWIAGARSLSLALDHIHTVPIESRPIVQLGLNEFSGGMLRVNDLTMSTDGPDDRPYPVQMKIDPAKKFVVQTSGHAIVLGSLDSLGQVVRPEPGDKARLQIDRCLLSWPTPLELNFMSGRSPSWRRHLYYRLIWEKPDGGQLEMIWRYEQPFYDDWASGFMIRAGTTGLLRVNIRP